MSIKFSPGDRVMCIREYGNSMTVDKIGTIVKMDEALVGVAFDEKVNGHNLGHFPGPTCPHGRGWFFPIKEGYLELHVEFETVTGEPRVEGVL